MEYCRRITKGDIARFDEIRHEYLFGDDGLIMAMYEKYPEVYGGYFIDDTMVGVCYGWPRSEQVDNDDSFTLDGIALIEPYNKCGRGSRLLKFFVDAANSIGYDCVSVGSAGGYVERYYLKNGFRPIEFKVMVEDGPTCVLPIGSMGEYDALTERRRAEITESVGGNHSFVVFEKRRHDNDRSVEP